MVKRLQYIILLSLIIPNMVLVAELKGKAAYMKSCVQCHGKNGAGGKTFGEGPNLTILKDQYALEQFNAILEGKRKGPGTETMMKALKESKLSDKELKAAFDYSMKLKKAPANHMGFGDAKKGEVKYKQACFHCHGPKAAGYQNPALPSPALTGQPDFYIVDMLKSFKKGDRGNTTPASIQMRGMSMTVANEQEMKDLAAYIRSFDMKKKTGAIEELTFKAYRGSWTMLPDFSKLKPYKSGKLHKGFIDIAVAEQTEQFGMVFDGYLTIPRDGKYQFALHSDDGSSMYLNGEKIIDNDGEHGVEIKSSSWLKLKKGRLPIQVRYFEKGGGETLIAEWKYEKEKKFSPLSVGTSGGHTRLEYVIEPQNGEARILRNFFSGTSSRGIAVGYPENTHIVFNASNMSLAYFWKDNFLDASRMWTNRGTKFIHPSSQTVKVGNDIQVAFLDNAKSKWPIEMNRKSNQIRTNELQFKGYTLNKKQYPTFMYRLKDVQFTDFILPKPESGSGLDRSIHAKAKTDHQNLWFRVTVDKIALVGDRYLVNDQYYVEAKNAQVRTFGKIHELLIPFTFKNNEAQIQISYSFAKGN